VKILLGKKPEQNALTKKLSYVPNSQSTHEIKAVNLDGSHTDLELLSDFPIGMPLGH